MLPEANAPASDSSSAIEKLAEHYINLTSITRFLDLNMTLRPLLSLLLLLSLSACSTTKMTDTWQEPAFRGQDMQKVLVVAVASNTTNRFLFETGFIGALNQKGIDATASFTTLGDALPTKEAVAAHLKESDYDHIIVTALGRVDIETDYVPERVRTYYTGAYYPHWSGYWGSGVGYYGGGGSLTTMTREAYTDTQTNVILTTSIYDVKTEQLAWVGRSKTFEVGSVSDMADSLAKQMIRKIKH
ncbi:MAG: hypothetical protein D9N13_23025 [Ketobacter sp. GenoA1]|nr:MAG: hypothetical protein D9N13_23025 [Ketobacter sp. GenoA1]RLT93417.1 MAG: hypothetical protein D9N15_20430 [Ketobacter sp.]